MTLETVILEKTVQPVIAPRAGKALTVTVRTETEIHLPIGSNPDIMQFVQVILYVIPWYPQVKTVLVIEVVLQYLRTIRCAM
jgi:hypothetical protein